MRLHALSIAGVGPFRHRQDIDVDALAASGLFLIEGPTGAGKTTIIDSIVFALYGSLSGAESDPARMRSDLCAPDEPTEVTLEFSIGGVRHTIRRNPAYERSAKRGSGTTTEKAAQTLEVHDGATPAMREAKEIGVYLTQRLGLTADQFRRLVVLPQGEFDRLLRAKPAERYKTLATLIDDGFLQRVQEDLKQQAAEARQAREAATKAVEDLRFLMRQRAAEVMEVSEDFDPQAAVRALSDLARAAESQAEALAGPLAQAQEAARAARERAEAAARARAARAAIDTARAALAPEDAACDGDALAQRATELTVQRTRLEPLAAWEREAADRDAELGRLRDAAATAADELAAARAEAQELPQRQREVGKQFAAAQQAAAGWDAATAEVERLEQVQVLLDDATALAAAATAARADVDARAAALQGARDRLQAARTAQHALLRTQLDQRAAHLAAGLAAGEPCPVCGSVEHPRPAATTDGALVSDDDVAAADTAVLAAEAAEAAARADHDTATQAVAQAEQQLASVHARIGDATADGVASQIAAARSMRDDAMRGRDLLPGLQEQSQALESQQAQSAQAIADLIAREATARTEYTTHEQQVALQSEQHRRRLAEVGATSAAAALADTDRRLTAIDAVLLAREAAVGLPVDVDPGIAASLAEEAEAGHAEIATRHRIADEARQRLTDARTVLAAQLDDLEAAIVELAGVDERTAPAIRLGALATADSPANRRKLTLQAYAVQRRFRSVLQAASVHLERMSSGQFAFALDETASGNAQSGLGIDIVDAWTGTTRDPGSLSGGETFYASLALALGLADVVREDAGGVSLETLFVDEGFGSLDADTLTVVLDQLDALRARGRTVGVISHVAEMKEWVHERVEVIPSRRRGAGSTIRQSGT